MPDWRIITACLLIAGIAVYPFRSVIKGKIDSLSYTLKNLRNWRRLGL